MDNGSGKGRVALEHTIMVGRVYVQKNKKEKERGERGWQREEKREIEKENTGVKKEKKKRRAVLRAKQQTKKRKIQTKRQVCVFWTSLSSLGSDRRAHEIWRKRECDVARARASCACKKSMWS